MAEQVTSSREINPALGDVQTVLTYGNRELVLTYNPYTQSVTTGLDRSSDKSKEAEENQTTELYREVKRICQELANRLGFKITYEFATAVTTMKLWASSDEKGMDLMHWDSTISQPNRAADMGQQEQYESETLICTKFFYPTNDAP